MIKRICIICLALLLCLASCKKDEPFVLDIASAAEKMLTEIEYYEELYPAESDMAKSLLALDESFDCEITMYIGSGASADSVIVARADDIEGLTEKINAYLDSQEELYASYMIFEADKISHAVTEVKENYIIVCITEDTDGAEKTVKEIFG